MFSRRHVTIQPQTTTKRRMVCFGFLCLSFLAAVGFGLPQRIQAAQNILPDPHVDTGLVTLRGNTHPEANVKNDRGPVSDDLPLDHMMLLLKRTPEQEQALQQFINDIHDPNSPLFHHWITAAEFGQIYGVPSAEIARVTDWLESQGFTVNLVYPNQMVIDFTGSAGLIRQAFHTEIHNLMVNGQPHIANMSDPQIPEELASTVAGVVSLNDFRPHPLYRPRTDYTVGTSTFAVVPGDLATIYNFNPAFTAGHSGQGQTIVVIEDTDLYATTDWSTFQSTFSLSTYGGTFTTVHPPPPSGGTSCTDPGVTADDAEAILDAEWSLAAAPSASIELASCANTVSNSGLFIALQNLLSPPSGLPPAIVSISYGASESLIGASGNLYIYNTYQQAVAGGVSLFVSSGDSGAAVSDDGAPLSQNGITVSGFTSTPYNVSVGGTDFADTYEGKNTTYWNPAASNTATFESALSYIPEIPWNNSCANALLADYHGFLTTYGASGLCNSSTGTAFVDTAGGSGGPSACASGAPDFAGAVSGTCGGYPKPSWQSGFTGNPNDSVRDIPDVALFAANGIWGHYYVFCYSDPTANRGGKSCAGAPSTWSGAGGTSISAPIMAGIQALVNQASLSRWGNPDTVYYPLAATEYASTNQCTSSNGVAISTCIFYDVTQIPLIHGGTGSGGDNDMPCYGLNCYLPAGAYANPTYGIPIGVLSAAPQTVNAAYTFVNSLGSGYTSNPTCTISNGGGTGATCSGIVTGVVSSVALSNAGSGYTSIPTCALTGGGGTGATCSASINTSPGVVSSVAITRYGGGYTSAPTCALTGGGGTGATCTATEVQGISISLTSPGSGYTSVPQCVLTGGGGSGGSCAALPLNTSGAYTPAFPVAPGWDFATGIGTVNASNLVAAFIPSVSLSTTSVPFGNQTVSTPSAAMQVTVTNKGGTPLSFTSIAVTGTNAGDFAIATGTTCSITAPVAAGGNCLINVTFTPTATGSRSANLTLTDNATGSPQAVTLSGTGTTSSVGLSPASVGFGNQPVGTTSAASSVTVTNNGSVSLSFTTIAVTGTNAGDFAIAATGTTCSTSAPVTAGGNCLVNLTFKPTATGSRSGALTLTDNGTGSPQSVTLSGTGTAAGVSLSTTTVTFPNEPVASTSAASPVTVTNSGTTSLSFTSLAVTGTNSGDFAIATTGTTCSTSTPVAAAGTCVINVTFTPTATGSRSGALTLTDNASTSPQSVTLSGTGTTPSVSLSTTTVTFSNEPVGTASAASPVTVTNNGTASLSFTSLAVTGTNAGDFAIAASGTTCSTSTPVAAGGNCLINVTFTPTATGSRSGALTLTDNATGSPQSVTLSGTGTAPGVSLSTTSVSFPNQAVGTTSAASPVTVTNNGTASLSFTSLAVTGTNSGDFAIAATGTTCSTSTPVAAGGNCLINLTFKPTATGSRSGALTLTDNATGSPQSVTLSGTGTAPSVSLSTTTVTFSNQTVGTTSAASPVTVTNNGTASLSFTSLAVTGTNAGDFAIAATGTTCSTSAPVAAGGNCLINVTFTPTATGSRSGTLTLTDNATGSPQTVTLSGTGTPAGVGLNPTSVSFGNQPVGTASAASPVTVTNNGTASLTFTSLAVTGTNAGDFAIAASGTTCTTSAPVAIGGTCVINVTFTPAATGSRAGTLTLTDNGVGSPQTVSLTGTGTVPVAGVSPAALTFSAQLLGTTSAAQAITLSNTGNAALTVTGIAVTGTNSSDFSVSTNPATNCGGAVAAAGSCTINVTFAPTAAGTRTGSLTITDNNNNSAGSTQTVTLSGTAADFTVAPPSGSSTSATVAPGATATYTLTVGGGGGATQTVAFTCSQAPSEATCTVTPSSAAPGSNVTVTVTTTAPSTASAPRPLPPPGFPGSPVLLMLAALLAGVAWTICRWKHVGAGRRWRVLLPVAGLLLTLALAGCHSGGTTTPNPGTPAGSYNLTVTATAGSGATAVSHNVLLTLIVT